MKKIIVILFAIAAVLSCKKKTVEGTYVVKGYVYKDCNKKPEIDMPLELKVVYYENNRPKYKTISSDTTDIFGQYTFNYSNAPEGDVYITYAGYPYPGYVRNIPFKNIDSLTFYSNASANVKSNIIVTNSYSKSDTLFVDGFGYYRNYKLTGPFTNGQLFPEFNFKSISKLDYGIFTTQTGISYKIGSNGNWIDSNIYVLPCSQNTINIEIK